jgi:hypothetical protein
MATPFAHWFFQRPDPQQFAAKRTLPAHSSRTGGYRSNEWITHSLPSVIGKVVVCSKISARRLERALDPRSEWAHTVETASGDCGLYRPVSTTGITCEVDFFLAIFL